MMTSIFQKKSWKIQRPPLQEQVVFLIAMAIMAQERLRQKNNLDDSDEENYKKEKEEVDEYNKDYNGKNGNKNIGNNTNTNLKNKKAICSDDYAESNVESRWKQMEKESRLKQMKQATAISSADLNGEEEDNSETFGDKVKNYAFNFGMFATQKVKELKDKSKDIINKIQEKYSG